MPMKCMAQIEEPSVTADIASTMRRRAPSKRPTSRASTSETKLP